MDLTEYFGEPVVCCTRAEMMETGDLIDVSKMASEAGFCVPVAISAALHADISAIPESQSHQDYDGRLWDVLWMSYLKIRMTPNTDSPVLIAPLIMHVGRSTYYHVRVVSGPGDEGEHVITLMTPTES